MVSCRSSSLSFIDKGDIDLGVVDLHDFERPGRCIFLRHSLCGFDAFASVRFTAAFRSMRSTRALIVRRSGRGKPFCAQRALTCSIRYVMELHGKLGDGVRKAA
jgi:hypothetical protein